MNARPDPAGLTDAIADGAVLLDVRNVSLSFGGVKAISDISFNILKGEIRAIIGPNGAGKTSMLNVINGFYTRSRAPYLPGQGAPRMRPHEAAAQGIARTFQNVALFKGMTTLDNIMTGRSLQDARNLFWQMLRRGPALSGGDRASRGSSRRSSTSSRSSDPQDAGRQAALRAAEARRAGRALAMEPELLLLDEPMAGMNVEEKEDMCRFILDVNDEFGTTIALIEHDMGVVMDISDRVVVLDYGRKIADGTPDAVQRDQEVIDAYLGVAH